MRAVVGYSLQALNDIRSNFPETTTFFSENVLQAHRHCWNRFIPEIGSTEDTDRQLQDWMNVAVLNNYNSQKTTPAEDETLIIMLGPLISHSRRAKYQEKREMENRQGFQG